MNRCKDCKYFIEKDPRRSPPVDFGTCTNPLFEYGEVKDKNTLFVYYDIDDYNADFFVNKNFGCVGFEKTIK